MNPALSPARRSYLNERLKSASVTMMLRASVSLAYGLAKLESSSDRAKIEEGPVSELIRIYRKFSEDLTPREFNQICNEVLHCRIVDSFDRYLSGMLFDVFTQRPETLRSSEQIRVHDVLECQDMTQVVQRIAERKVVALAYQGFDGMMDYLSRTLGLSMDPDKDMLSIVREALEVRNIIVHNGGVVNGIFRRRAHREDLVEGALFPLDQDYAIRAGRAADDLVQLLDVAFIEHFKLVYAPVPTGETRSSGIE